MSRWSLADVPWDTFDPAKVDPDILRIVKAASMVEINADDYVSYLERVFAQDAELLGAIADWGAEEAQHGNALAAWAKLADPDFDFAAARAAFAAGFHIDTQVDRSIRGSRTGELVARCIVETGTSSFYSALAEAAEEPVLRFICRKIAADELRHYKLFYDGAKQYQKSEGISAWARFKVALDRIIESEDDELAYAYYAANGAVGAYERKHWTQEYAARAYAIYKRPHIDRGIAMVLKAIGFNPTGWLHRLLSGAAWAFMQRRLRVLGRERLGAAA